MSVLSNRTPREIAALIVLILLALLALGSLASPAEIHGMTKVPPDIRMTTMEVRVYDRGLWWIPNPDDSGIMPVLDESILRSSAFREWIGQWTDAYGSRRAAGEFGAIMDKAAILSLACGATGKNEWRCGVGANFATDKTRYVRTWSWPVASPRKTRNRGWSQVYWIGDREAKTALLAELLLGRR